MISPTTESGGPNADPQDETENASLNKLPLPRMTGPGNPSAKDAEKESQQRFLEALFNLKRLSPYYHTILSAITRKPALGLGTCAVTEDTLYYDPAFAGTLSVPELTFILIHEVMHIAMQHSVRFGKRTDHDLWNIACDLYINSIICKDFRLRSARNSRIRERTYTIEGKSCSIRVPPFGVFPDSAGLTIDLSRDTPETIYDRLIAENPCGASQAESGAGSSTAESGPHSSTAESGSNSSSVKSNPHSSTAESGSGSSSGSGRAGEYSPQKTVRVRLDGKELTGTLPVDLMTGLESSGPGKRQDAMEAGMRALQRIRTRIALEEQENGGVPLEKNAGAGGSLIKRYLEYGLSPRLRWQELLRNLCSGRPRKIFTVAPPNVDYMNRGITLAARRPAGKSDGISKIKLCVDVSGSLSREDLSRILAEIGGIFRFFRLDGELIFWSDTVGNAGPVSNRQDAARIEALSAGGTDVLCLFRYLAGETTVNGRREKDKVRDMPAVFIFTDGHFEANYGGYEGAFGRKTVWIVTGNEVLFRPLFGRVVPLGSD